MTNYEDESVFRKLFLSAKPTDNFRNCVPEFMAYIINVKHLIIDL